MSSLISVRGLVPTLGLGCLSLAATAFAQQLPDGPGKEIVARVCSACHSTETIEGRHQDKAQWTDTVFKMVDFGAETTKDERESIIAYLAATFGPLRAARPPAATTAPAADALPDLDAVVSSGAAKGKINVNEATAEDLVSVLDLTEKDAEAIVRYRQEHGHFKDWRDVVKVEGIDGKKIETAKDRLTIGESDDSSRKP